ncbi:DUF2690 domain-containing protein [Streptomyces sp. NPDC048291]|uniref:DUF2690 domain-containing protein n=1 Tax=Streptomyces sp. NPDC048291 TaxID=3365530 RepID=UPI00371A0AA8
MPRRRRLLSCLAALALAGGCVLTVSTPASAVGCQGSACDGASPVTMGCDGDARLLDEVDATNLSVRFYHSPTCDASWAYVTSALDSTIAVDIYYLPQFGGTEAYYTADYLNPGDVAKPTPMVGGNAQAKGCTEDDGPGADPAPEVWQQEGDHGLCTAWH